jgi:Protein of unknown function (DUF2946)
VYVELEAAPWVWRVDADASVRSHTGLEGVVRSTWLDEHGRLFLDTDLGLGIVHTLDMHEAANKVESGAWQPQPLPFALMAERFGHVLSPQARAAVT